jgi:hypothetical protein
MMAVPSRMARGRGARLLPGLSASVRDSGVSRGLTDQDAPLSGRQPDQPDVPTE